MTQNSGYTQQFLHPNSQKLTTIVTPFGLIEFTWLSIELRNDPPPYSHYVCDINSMQVYFDDVNIYDKRPQNTSSDKTLYQLHLDPVCQFLNSVSQLTVGLMAKSLAYPNSRLLDRIKTYPPRPRKCCSCSIYALGLVNYYRSFISMMAILQHSTGLQNVDHLLNNSKPHLLKNAYDVSSTPTNHLRYTQLLQDMQFLRY